MRISESVKRMGSSEDGASPFFSDHASPLNHTDEHNNDGQHQQKVNEATKCVGAHHSERPQYEQYHRDSPKHWKPAFPVACDRGV